MDCKENYLLEQFKDEIIAKIKYYKSISKVAKYYSVNVSELIEFLDLTEVNINQNNNNILNKVKNRKDEITRINEINYMIWRDLA